MLTTVKQGVISGLIVEGLPAYLSIGNNTVSTNSAIVPMRVSFAHGASHYLLRISTPLVWSPIVNPVEYLYVDMNMFTSDATTGKTILAPVYQLTAPTSPANDQHWFDLNTNKMKVFDASRQMWRERIRVFVGSIVNSTLRQSFGNSFPNTETVNTGYVVVDSFGKPVRLPSGEFLTSATRIGVKANNNQFGVGTASAADTVFCVANGEIPVMAAVKIIADDRVDVASGNDNVIGIATNGAAPGEVVEIVKNGTVSFDQWNFVPGRDLWLGSYGDLSHDRSGNSTKIGTAQNKNTIVLDINNDLYLTQEIGNEPQLVDFSDVYEFVTGGVPTGGTLRQALDSKSNSGHKHYAADILDLQQVIDEVAQNDLVAGSGISIVNSVVASAPEFHSLPISGILSGYKGSDARILIQANNDTLVLPEDVRIGSQLTLISNVTVDITLSGGVFSGNRNISLNKGSLVILTYIGSEWLININTTTQLVPLSEIFLDSKEVFFNGNALKYTYITPIDNPDLALFFNGSLVTFNGNPVVYDLSTGTLFVNGQQLTFNGSGITLA
jgi:hypothetical protein